MIYIQDTLKKWSALNGGWTYDIIIIKYFWRDEQLNMMASYNPQISDINISTRLYANNKMY